ncbi:lysophospholipid acyltransferase family protein [Agromyces sp. G08B096]|uniref:Lysophospholipid acyltransferase family protein n=1 Tax=Agromyces sp. G08B096 TaxID=3156399 RepID=A0AAU7WC32_9MICO
MEADAVPAAPKRPGPLYLVVRGILRPLVRLVYRPKITGAELVPRRGPVIFASNHLSFVDSIVIPLAAPRPVQFLAKSHYFTGTGLKGWVSRTFFGAIGAVSVERGAGSQAQEALDQGRRILEAGNAFALYPEGTRSLDGRLYRGRTGVAWLALTTGATVVPVGLIGTQEIQPVGSKLPRIAPVTVRFGEPLDLSHHGPATSGRARRQATDEIMAAIHALSGQELAGVYNEAPPQGALARLADRIVPHERV